MCSAMFFLRSSRFGNSDCVLTIEFSKSGDPFIESYVSAGSAAWAVSPFAFPLWQLRLEVGASFCFHRVTSVFNSWELPRQDVGGQGLKRQVLGFPPGSQGAGRCRVSDVRKMPFFCRLEIEILLRALDLRAFLIGRSAIRNWVVGFRLRRRWAGERRVVVPIVRG